MATDKGVKLDDGKNRLGLVLGGFASAIKEVGCIGTFGANKYTDNGWQSVPNGVARYTDALLRHLFAHFEGEEIDPESGYRHLAHVAWNCLAILSLTHKKEFLKRKFEPQIEIKNLGGVSVDDMRAYHNELTTHTKKLLQDTQEDDQEKKLQGIFNNDPLELLDP